MNWQRYLKNGCGKLQPTLDREIERRIALLTQAVAWQFGVAASKISARVWYDAGGDPSIMIVIRTHSLVMGKQPEHSGKRVRARKRT